MSLFSPKPNPREGIAMPTYDFKCKKCRKPFTVIAPISRVGKTKCPKCGKRDIERIYEAFTAITKKKT
jgi:putative FmdB family regulatory protein